uniref:Uncharacterized protein n=1 Tax=Oryza sativa subsp. japonica TaxID=39947 RepID=Q69WH6_ORYSJ|nr:hypothetical protein [Oryza sativa Japonica Group]BAD32963.1 hypothetical protein [Oryza sativa Japonica Group]
MIWASPSIFLATDEGEKGWHAQRERSAAVAPGRSYPLFLASLPVASSSRFTRVTHSCANEITRAGSR